jgi:hypothetical protein
MVSFALFFPYAYSVSPYLRTSSYHSYQGRFLGTSAWVGLFNPMEIPRAITFASRIVAESREGDATERAGEYSQVELQSNTIMSANSRLGDTEYYARQSDGRNPSLYVSPAESHARGPGHGFQGAYVPLLDKDGHGMC